MDTLLPVRCVRNEMKRALILSGACSCPSPFEPINLLRSSKVPVRGSETDSKDALSEPLMK
jgi:hypothetical protein